MKIREGKVRLARGSDLRWISTVALMIGALSGTLSLTSCLKTRAQLKGDSEDQDLGKSIAVQPIQDVHPQSQYVVDELKDEMTRMEGRMEDLERSVQETAAKVSTRAGNEQKEALKALETRIAQLEQSQASLLEELNKLQVSAVDPEESFTKAKAAFKAGNYSAAIEALSSYLKSPKAKKAEDAIFMRAESYYKLKDYKKAVVDYSKFPEKHSRSPLMPQALYKIGLSFDALGMKDDAKGFYQELVEKYPKSPEAKKARKKVK